MTDVLFSGSAFLDTTVRGLVYQRRFELYTGDSGSCGALSADTPADMTAYPNIIASVRVPGGNPIRITAVWIRNAPPAIFSISIPRNVINQPFLVNESSLLVTVAGFDSGGNEEPIIKDGQLVILQGGL